MRVRPPTSSIPDAPGSYQFLDPFGKILYVGKAKSLRHRLANYFGDSSLLPHRTAELMALAERVEWVVVTTELEALVLEHSLIQTHKPRFNVRLKDDKSYPWLAITMDDEWPRPAIVRGKKKKGVRYFGPYGHVGAIRDTLDLLLRSFPLRSCSDTKYKRHERLGRPCLLYDIERCSGPCIGAVEHQQYSKLVTTMTRFLSGDIKPVVSALERDMKDAAEHEEFERAARIRDRLVMVNKAAETQLMVSDRAENFDVIGVFGDDLESAVQVFFVRVGRVVGRIGSIADNVETFSTAQMMARVIEQIYGTKGTEIPPAILVPLLPEDHEVVRDWLETLRGRPVQLKVPLRGDKRSLMETVERNACEDLARHRLRRSNDHDSRTRALVDLGEYLDLKDAPLRIECYDMSHLGGTDYVGSMVVLEDGLAKRSDYRRFKVKTVEQNDDYAAIEEVLTRRLQALIDERTKVLKFDQEERGILTGEKKKRFSYPPNLILIDGGKGQLSVAIRVVHALGLDGEFELAALAKRFEEVYRPGIENPIFIPRGAEALFLLQRIRDEAHRFAISFHRERRGKRMTNSVLDGVVGLGNKRRLRLLKEFGGMTKLRLATKDQLTAIGWLPRHVGEGVYDHIHAMGENGSVRGVKKTVVQGNE